ncbi:hypothetical protein ETB97_012300 [Aspergillus alliaceus]|uniref:Uncharacterized protein n=1 Tax=Petromyces alliaceus TaxID=209559 RepID=A0A8H6E756_PETAA|nr:hypothetical protein ETB97_012300 [Aspergillus burnettii]
MPFQLYFEHKTNPGETQDWINSLKGSITTHSDHFQALHQAFKRGNPTVIYVKAKQKRESSVKGQIRPRTSKHEQPANCQERSKCTISSCSQMGAAQCQHHDSITAEHPGCQLRRM